MKIYNGKSSQIDLPLANGTRLVIGPKSLSKDFWPDENFLALIATSYEESEIALIVGGAAEMVMCAKIAPIEPLVVYSIDDAITKFNPLVHVEETKDSDVSDEEPDGSVPGCVDPTSVESATSEEGGGEHPTVLERGPVVIKRIRRSKKSTTEE